MNRRIIFKSGTVASAQGDQSKPAEKDDALSRLSKLVPPETLTFYIAATGGITLAREGKFIAGPLAEWLQLALFIVGGIGSWFIVKKLVMRNPATGRYDNAPPEPKQLYITVIAFAVWALAVGSPLAAIGWHDSRWVGPILAPLVTFLLVVFPQ